MLTSSLSRYVPVVDFEHIHTSGKNSEITCIVILLTEDVISFEVSGPFQDWDVLVEVGEGGSPAYRKQALEARRSDWIVTEPPAPMTLLIMK